MPPLDMSPLPGGQLHKASPAGAGAAPPPPPPLFCSVPATDLIGAFRGLGLAAAEHGTPPAACPPLPAYADASACTSLASSAATADIGSPLTAFVAARERLLDRLGRPTPPDADPQPGSLAADAAAAQPAAVPLGNLRLQSQRTGHLLLKERLASTMQLCQRLHEQNQDSMQKVSRLLSDNQSLSRSVQEARTGKNLLQQTIRQLSQEAAQLAEQARLALLPGVPAPPAQPPAAATQRPTSAPAAAERQPEPASAPAAAAPQPQRPASAPASVPAATSVPSFVFGRDWSQVSVASSGGGASSKGTAWRPGTSVRSFDWSSRSSSRSSSVDGGSSDGGAAWCIEAPAMYVQAGSDGGCGDKRRRLVPGGLAHCLRPEMPAAVPEAAEEEEVPAPCHSTPGRTPKRKLLHRSPTPVAAPGDEHAAAAAAASQEAGEEVAMEQRSPERFATFRLLESRWHGGSPLPSPPSSPPLSARRHLRRRGVCSIM